MDNTFTVSIKYTLGDSMVTIYNCGEASVTAFMNDFLSGRLYMIRVSRED